MNSCIKIALATCLTILIFAGSVPFLIQTSKAETHGFKLCNTPKGDLFIPKDRECPKGSTTAYSGRLTIEFIESSGHSSEVTFKEARAESEILGSLNQDGRFDLSSTFGHGACSNFLNGHHQIFAGTPKFHLIGDTKGVRFASDLFISGNCSIPNPPQGFAFRNLVFHGGNGGFFESEGHAAQNLCELPNCSRSWYWILTLSPTLAH